MKFVSYAGFAATIALAGCAVTPVVDETAPAAVEPIDEETRNKAGFTPALDGQSVTIDTKREALFEEPRIVMVPPKLLAWDAKGGPTKIIGGRLRFHTADGGSTVCQYDAKGVLAHCSGTHQKMTPWEGPVAGPPGKYDPNTYVFDVRRVKVEGAGAKSGFVSWANVGCRLSGALLGLTAYAATEFVCFVSGIGVLACHAPPAEHVRITTSVIVSEAAAAVCRRVASSAQGTPRTPRPNVRGYAVEIHNGTCTPGSTRYCRNVQRRKKGLDACNDDQFAPGGITNCAEISGSRPGGCAQLEAMIQRIVRCRESRVAERDRCYTRESGDHRTPIADANTKLRACIAKFDLLANGCRASTGRGGQQVADATDAEFENELNECR
jgi:hypothetical protein